MPVNAFFSEEAEIDLVDKSGGLQGVVETLM
jgi:hypothetical protein